MMIRESAIPEARAARSFSPTAYSRRPAMERARSTPETTMMITSAQPSTGMPSALACPSQRNSGSDLLRMFSPRVMMRAMPLKTICVPRVTMMKFAFTLAMSQPFTRPQAAPVARAAVMATA